MTVTNKYELVILPRFNDHIFVSEKRYYHSILGKHIKYYEKKSSACAYNAIDSCEITVEIAKPEIPIAGIIPKPNINIGFKIILRKELTISTFL